MPAFAGMTGSKMTLLATLKDIADRLLGEDEHGKKLRDEELRLAAAALLVHASVVDGHADPEEQRKIKSLLQARFNLGDDEFNRILQEAEAWERDSVDLYSFTSVISRELDQDGRQRIVEMLWEIVLADGVVHEYEADLVSRGADLLGVSPRDRVRLRKMVEARQSGSD
jgi:uncharacterized tellurite resistance protein B-like protein